jgi:hypothetical protein
MKDVREIAVKVQCPNIMNQIALDMHLLREFAPIAKGTFNLSTDRALLTFIFGPDKANVNTRIVYYKCVKQMVTGFYLLFIKADQNLLLGWSYCSSNTVPQKLL